MFKCSLMGWGTCLNPSESNIITNRNHSLHIIVKGQIYQLLRNTVAT